MYEKEEGSQALSSHSFSVEGSMASQEISVKSLESTESGQDVGGKKAPSSIAMITENAVTKQLQVSQIHADATTSQL